MGCSLTHSTNGEISTAPRHHPIFNTKVGFILQAKRPNRYEPTRRYRRWCSLDIAAGASPPGNRPASRTGGSHEASFQTQTRRKAEGKIAVIHTSPISF